MRPANEEIHATITCYWHNRAEVEAYMHRLAAAAEADYQKWLAGPLPLAVERLRTIRADRTAAGQRSP